MANVKALLEMLDLERLEKNLFRGQHLNIGSPNVFGGQILAQALTAASQTVPTDRQVHSLHAYFILPGDLKVPTVFEVDPIRDGRSFTTRRIVAIQNGKAIFNMSASFQVAEEGYSHQAEMPEIEQPENLKSYAELSKPFFEKLGMVPFGLFSVDSPVDFRPVEWIDPFQPKPHPPKRHLWFKTNSPMPDDTSLHCATLAYASDINLLGTSMLPHAISYYTGQIIAASLDHAMWFHRPFRTDEWLLYTMESPSSSHARGFSRGQIFNRNGDLVASIAQEGLIRKRTKKKS